MSLHSLAFISLTVLLLLAEGRCLEQQQVHLQPHELLRQQQLQSQGQLQDQEQLQELQSQAHLQQVQSQEQLHQQQQLQAEAQQIPQGQPEHFDFRGQEKYVGESGCELQGYEGTTPTKDQQTIFNEYRGNANQQSYATNAYGRYSVPATQRNQYNAAQVGRRHQGGNYRYDAKSQAVGAYEDASEQDEADQTATVQHNTDEGGDHHQYRQAHGGSYDTHPYLSQRNRVGSPTPRQYPQHAAYRGDNRGYDESQQPQRYQSQAVQQDDNQSQDSYYHSRVLSNVYKRSASDAYLKNKSQLENTNRSYRQTQGYQQDEPKTQNSSPKSNSSPPAWRIWSPQNEGYGYNYGYNRDYDYWNAGFGNEHQKLEPVDMTGSKSEAQYIADEKRDTQPELPPQYTPVDAPPNLHGWQAISPYKSHPPMNRLDEFQTLEMKSRA